MKTNQSWPWMMGLSLMAGGLFASPSLANSYSDITGTNIWNNVAPVLEPDQRLDPKLVEDANRLNREGETAFNECNAAIAQLEQATPARRFSRQPQTPPPVPTACTRLEQIRAEAATLRSTLQQLDVTKVSSDYSTW